MIGMTPHFCRGKKASVAFVFSAPGKREEESGAPVSGATGENLDAALRTLHRAARSLFPSERRYDYRITNAYAGILHKGKHGRTEASRAEILADDNLARVLSELRGARTAVLCGGKAALLRGPLEAAGIRTILAAHCGARGLSGLYPCVHPALRGLISGRERRLKRAELWARRILKSLDYP